MDHAALICFIGLRVCLLAVAPEVTANRVALTMSLIDASAAAGQQAAAEQEAAAAPQGSLL
jgi:hypothetical protein